MLARKALIRKLPAVEALGSVTVICSDKTGTLTENRMTVTALYVNGRVFDFSADSQPAEPGVDLLLTGFGLCNDASIERGREPVGDPTETALVVAAGRFGLWKDQLESEFVRIAELSFDARRKRMTTVHRFSPAGATSLTGLEKNAHGIGGVGESSYIQFTKGAVDNLLNVSASVWANGDVEPLADDKREEIREANDQLAQEGMRVLGLAFRLIDSGAPDERDLVFVGMAGMIDPLRREVKDAVDTCTSAGIRPVMITGDHPLTAEAIARELGLANDGRFLTGQQLAKMSVAELERIVEGVSVYARVSPEDKLKIVEALQNRGHIAAMTGDGVNDAPALKKADIGIAMGITGADVSKEAADMVLLDDNFATIVAAVKEGRVIYDNIRKFVKYIVTTNSAEIWVMLLAPLAGMPLPLLPLQILWMNLVTDGPLALALAVEPAERDVMRQPPYSPKESIFASGMGRHIIWVGMLMSLVSLGVGWWYWQAGRESWQTMLFTTLTLAQIGHVAAIRSGRESFFRIGLLSNKPLLGAATLIFGLHFAVIYAPFLQDFFRTRALGPVDLVLCLVLGSVVFWAVEIEKYVCARCPKTSFPVSLGPSG
jgi:Ca2+-transporting ATPase